MGANRGNDGKRGTRRMSIICHIDGSEHEDVKSVHALLKSLRIKQADYYARYEPRLDRLTQEPIPYKDHKQYFADDFANQNNLKKWLKLYPEDGRRWLIEKLLTRKEEKSLKYALSQIELKLLGFPSIPWIEENFKGGYQSICVDINLPTKYTNDKIVMDFASPLSIIEDTREQKGLKFPPHVCVQREKLNYGDLASFGNRRLAIERKSLTDACGTLSKGYPRFVKEINRAKEDNGYLIVCVEESFENFKSIQYLPHTRHVRASYSFLAHRIRSLYQSFDNIQFCFCNGRSHMSRVVEVALKNPSLIVNSDIQLFIDSNDL